MKKTILAALSAVGMLSGCYPYHHRHYHADPVDACLLTTCLADTCIIDTCLNPHRYDAPPPEYHHHHGPGCGCPSRYDRGQRVYYFEGRWEYEDGAPW